MTDARKPVAFSNHLAPGGIHQHHHATKTGPLYSAGLAVVAFAMVLLPLIYMALIALTAWGVLWHLKNDTWIFSSGSGRGGFVRLILYLGPAVAGGILAFFMVKPFFAKKAKAPKPITLDR